MRNVQLTADAERLRALIYRLSIEGLPNAAGTRTRFVPVPIAILLPAFGGDGARFYRALNELTDVRYARVIGEQR